MSWLAYSCSLLAVAVAEYFISSQTNHSAPGGALLFLAAYVFALEKKDIARAAAFFMAGLLADLFFSPLTGAAATSFTVVGILLGYAPEFPPRSVVLRMFFFMLSLLACLFVFTLLTSHSISSALSTKLLVAVIPVAFLYPFVRMISQRQKR